MSDLKKLNELAKLVRFYILFSSTKAGSGHPTSSLSATDVMVTLFFEKLRFDLSNPDNPNNDRVIFSKGHVSPLIYALYAAAGVLTEKELATYRQFGSTLEGHPTPRFKYIEVATGSLGQGLSIGLGMAIALRAQNQKSPASPSEAGRAKIKNQKLPKVYVLMGDSEVSEGSVWEAIEVASHYKLDNLVGIIDVNRLGQSGETMLGHDVDTYKRRVEAFGWDAYVINGHNFLEILNAFDKASIGRGKPQMIIAKTLKGKGVSFLEDKEGWHGKALKQEEYEKAVKELGRVDKSILGMIAKPSAQNARGPVTSFLPAYAEASAGKPASESSAAVPLESANWRSSGAGIPSAGATPRRASIVDHTFNPKLPYRIGEEYQVRKAYGEALARVGEENPNIVSLDAEVKNSTYAEIFKEKFPERFFEMYIAEQNMVGVALGLSKRGKIPFVSTFAAFLTRAFDQIRMSAYCKPNVKFVGSHTGVSIGEDGASQMGLEDIAMFRAVFDSVVLCPGDAVACHRLVELAAKTEGLFYIRTSRPATPVIYKGDEKFEIGGSKEIRSSPNDRLTIVSCGVVLTEAIKAADELSDEGIKVRLIDAYSIKPIDENVLRQSARETNSTIITVEDHYFEGGLGDAVLNVFAKEGRVQVYKLAVCKLPMSGRPKELLEYEGISSKEIVKKVKEILG